MSALTVLFVDDEPAVADAVRRVLRGEPHRLLSATSGQEGLEVLAREQVDIVVSDERMPEMTGSEFLTSVRTLYPDTIRIMLTGQASLDAAIKAINDGEIFRFLTKPCDPNVLSSTIREAGHRKLLIERSADLLAEAKRQREIIEDLERRHPGITTGEASRRGEVVVAEENVDMGALLADLDAFLESSAS